MQKLLLSLCLICATSVLFAQKISNRSATKRSTGKTTDHSNVIKLGLNTFFDTDQFPFSISWETKVGSNESIQIGVLPRVSRANDDKTNGVGVNAAFRKYISKNRTGIQGLFISPVVKFGVLDYQYSYNTYYYGSGQQPQSYTYSQKTKTNQFNIGLVFGHKWAYRSGFTFEASAGMGYYQTKDKESRTNFNGTAVTTSNNTYNYSGIMPQLQLSFGYAF